MRISDWSSDVCSSDLPSPSPRRHTVAHGLGEDRVGVHIAPAAQGEATRRTEEVALALRLASGESERQKQRGVVRLDSADPLLPGSGILCGSALRCTLAKEPLTLKFPLLPRRLPLVPSHP